MNWKPHNIKEFRAALGLTQQRFATRAGVALSTVARWERGENLPTGQNTLDRLTRMAADFQAVGSEAHDGSDD